MSAKRKWAIVAIVVAILLVCPFQTTVVPEQRVLFVTNDMHPIKGALIRQIWQNYSLERDGHEQDLPTDGHGRVTFPKRTIRAPLIWRALGPFASIAGQGVHASFGIHTDMFPVPSSGGTIVYAEIAQPQPGEIVFR
jgi:hypothetical protein